MRPIQLGERERRESAIRKHAHAHTYARTHTISRGFDTTPGLLISYLLIILSSAREKMAREREREGGSLLEEAIELGGQDEQ